MLWKFAGPTGFTPTVTIYRGDNNALIGSGVASEGPPGFYSVSIATSYSGNVLAAISDPAGSLYGSTNDGVLREDPPLPGAPAPTVLAAGAPDVKAAAADPQSITVDGMSVTNRSVAETIAADRHLSAQNAAAKSNTFGIGLRRIIPGSSVGQ